MLRLHGFFTQNSLKALYVLEASGLEYEFSYTDLTKGEQRSADFREKNPIGKVPVLEHDGRFLAESGAICRYVGALAKTPIYPSGEFERAVVDQWMDYFTCHGGRWLTVLYFETFIKPKFGIGEPNPTKVEEATHFAGEMLQAVDAHLASSDWLANNEFSVADLFAYAYVEQERDIDFSIDSFQHLLNWYQRVDARKEIQRARTRLPS